MTKITTVRGTVEAASPTTHGIKLGDTWYNLAGEAVGPPAALPRKGTTVELTIFEGKKEYLSWSLARAAARPSGQADLPAQAEVAEVKKQEITGIVVAISDDGLRVNDTWYNRGKFFNAPFPAVGEKVKVTYVAYPGKDGGTERRYLSAVEVLSDIKESPHAGEQPSLNGRAERDVLIAREVALKAAVELLVTKAQAGENITLKAVKDTAEIFEAWILRQETHTEGD